MRETDKKQSQIKQNTFKYCQARRREETGCGDWGRGPGDRQKGSFGGDPEIGIWIVKRRDYGDSWQREAQCKGPVGCEHGIFKA